MECVLEAQPLPEITWFQGTKALKASDRLKMKQKETGKDTYLLTLEISNPSLADGGNYRCNAVNACGESNANIALNFQGTACLIVTSLSLSSSVQRKIYVIKISGF